MKYVTRKILCQMWPQIKYMFIQRKTLILIVPFGLKFFLSQMYSVYYLTMKTKVYDSQYIGT